MKTMASRQNKKKMKSWCNFIFLLTVMLFCLVPVDVNRHGILHRELNGFNRHAEGMSCSMMMNSAHPCNRKKSKCVVEQKAVNLIVERTMPDTDLDTVDLLVSSNDRFG